MILRTSPNKCIFDIKTADTSLAHFVCIGSATTHFVYRSVRMKVYLLFFAVSLSGPTMLIPATCHASETCGDTSLELTVPRESSGNKRARTYFNRMEALFFCLSRTVELTILARLHLKYENAEEKCRREIGHCNISIFILNCLYPHPRKRSLPIQ